MKTFLLYVNTLKYLKLKQIFYQLYYRLPTLWPRHLPILKKRTMPKQWIHFSPRSSFKPHDWRAKDLTRLQAYHAHYFEDLAAINSEAITHWILHNPVGRGVGWEPYPLSLRIVNWIKWGSLDQRLSQEIELSLIAQVDHLERRLEYHLLGNHLLSNAKALIFAGLYFTGARAERWLKTGMKILTAELKEQVLSDGAHFELSPMYHALVLEDLLDLCALFAAYQLKVPDLWTLKISSMLQWLSYMIHPDGEISFFNDATFNQAAIPAKLFDYARLLGFTHPFINKTVLLQTSGYARLEKAPFTVLIDFAAIGAAYLPGHGHADHLSFECSVFEQRVLVNSGVSTYERGVQREFERSSKAHNCLVVDQLNSSEVWASFRVGMRAKTRLLSFKEEADEIRVSAQHDGYKRLFGSPIHTRSWRLNAKGLEIVDLVEGKGPHSLEIYLHFHPEVQISQEGGKFLLVLKKCKLSFQADELLNFELRTGYYYPEFGCKIPNSHLYAHYEGELPKIFSYSLTFAKNAS